MKNKVLISLIIPEIDQKYDIFLPINKKIGEIIMLFNKSLNEMNNTNNNYKYLYNGSDGTYYKYNDLVGNTNIRNGSILVLID